MRNFDHSLPMLLLRAREAAMARFRPILAAGGLTDQQWRVLRVLVEHREMDAKELAGRTMMLKPSMSGVLDRLERDGLVERRKNRPDARRTGVRLTRKARRLYERLSPLLEREYTALESGFSTQKWNELYASLQQLIRQSGK